MDIAIGTGCWEVDKTFAVGKQQDVDVLLISVMDGWMALKAAELLIKCWDLSLIRSRGM